MLEDFYKDWNAGYERKATYTNLDPGGYIFRVIASNNDGVWNKKGTSLKIIITPPFWKTKIAYLGADAYVSKPFNSALLNTQVENLLESRRLRSLFSKVKTTHATEAKATDVDKEFLKKAEELFWKIFLIHTLMLKVSQRN